MSVGPSSKLKNMPETEMEMRSMMKGGPFQREETARSGQEALEKYVELDEEIARLQATSPTTLLAQKKEQVQQIDQRVQRQQELVNTLEENT